jgi:hypothetical protein
MSAVPQERVEASVDPKVLDTYTGQYQSPTGRVYTVTREGNKLVFVAPDGGKSEWLPLSETEFFIKGQPQTLRFVRDDRGRVTHYTYNLRGQTTHIVKQIK